MAEPTRTAVPFEADAELLYSQAPFGYVSTDTDWVILRANGTFAEIVGIRPDRLIGRKLGSLLAPGSRARHATIDAPLLAREHRIDEVSSAMLHVDGSQHRVLMTSVLQPSDGDHPDVIRTSVLLRRDRREPDRQLRIAQRQARAADERLHLLQQAVATLAGAKSLAEVVVGMEKAAKDAGLASAELWLPRADGNLGRMRIEGDDVRTEVALLSDEAIALSFRNGTTIAANEQQIIVSPVGPPQQPLGVMVLDRGNGVINVDSAGENVAARDRNMLTAVGHEVGQALLRAELNVQREWFLGAAAHDLRNPVTLVIGFASTLARQAEDRLLDSDRKMLATIVEAGERMSALIDDLLDFVATEAGTISLDLRTVDLLSLVDAVLERHAAAAAAKQITVKRQSTLDRPQVRVDERRIGQVLENLVSNAVKFSPPGSTVTIAVSKEERRALIEVRDDGPGIPEEELPDIFKAFHRASNRPTAGEGSTGLGLSIAKNIIEAHGGTIAVASVVGGGTTFRCRLPLLGSGDSQPDARASAEGTAVRQ